MLTVLVRVNNNWRPLAFSGPRNVGGSVSFSLFGFDRAFDGWTIIRTGVCRPGFSALVDKED